MPESSPLIVALDSADLGRVCGWAEVLRPHVGLFKLGLEFFLAHGAAGYRAVTGAPIFLDLKLHDIPNTVAGAMRAVLPLRPRMVTVHAGGGAAMVNAAVTAAASAGADRPAVLAVTVLTSLSGADLQAMGVAGSPSEQVVRLGRLAVDSGADGLVCSPQEVSLLRQALGPTVMLVVPGIRPADSAQGDQARVMTPIEAMQAGADRIVVGRPVTGAANPAEAAASILRSLQ
jgi:orotidine-5'-phosphate decarboxylase